jgi:hypothetical protein
MTEVITASEHNFDGLYDQPEDLNTQTPIQNRYSYCDLGYCMIFVQISVCYVEVDGSNFLVFTVFYLILSLLLKFNSAVNTSYCPKRNNSNFRISLGERIAYYVAINVSFSIGEVNHVEVGRLSNLIFHVIY